MSASDANDSRLHHIHRGRRNRSRHIPRGPVWGLAPSYKYLHMYHSETGS